MCRRSRSCRSRLHKESGPHGPDEWHGAPFWAGVVAFAPLSNDRERYLAAARANGERNAWQPGPEPFSADHHAITQSYFMLYAVDRDPKEAYYEAVFN